MSALITYKTKQRDQILACLMQYKERHVTAEEILAALNRENAKVGRTTIYRYVETLVSQGIVRKYSLDGSKSASYQYVEQNPDCYEHFHLKCTDCGRLVHLDCDYLGKMDAHIKDHHDFLVDHSKTVLYGKCGSCAKKPEGNQK